MSATTEALPKVVIDARMVGPIPHGIARYVTRLASGLRGLYQKSPLPYTPVFLVSREFSKTRVGGNLSFEGWPVQEVDAPFLSWQELFQLPQALHGAALYHSPSFSSLFTKGPYRVPCPTVVTIHDLNHLAYGNFSRKLYYRAVLKPFARRSAAITTVSQFSRKEIAHWLAMDESRIEVVYNALDPQDLAAPTDAECQEVLSRFKLQRGKYFLCLSNPKPHKNIRFLIEAYHRAQTDWPLVLTMDEYKGYLGVLAVGGLSDQDVRVLRSCAGAMVFPSLYEGFGLPPVEAIASGVPLIVSDIPPHREGLVAAKPEEVRWIDPNRLESLAEAIQSAARSELPVSALETRRKTLELFGEAELATRMDRIYRLVLKLGS